MSFLSFRLYHQQHQQLRLVKDSRLLHCIHTMANRTIIWASVRMTSSQCWKKKTRGGWVNLVERYFFNFLSSIYFFNFLICIQLTLDISNCHGTLKEFPGFEISLLRFCAIKVWKGISLTENSLVFFLRKPFTLEVCLAE